MDLSDQFAKQDLFILSIYASICIPHAKDLSIFIPKNDMSEVLGIRLFEYYGKGRREVTSPLLPCKG
jgi:hypothetical protein